MAAQTIKMLRKDSDGRLFPYTEALAMANGMTVVEILDKDYRGMIRASIPKKEEPFKPYLAVDERPGIGWAKNHFGKWVRKENLPKKRRTAKMRLKKRLEMRKWRAGVREKKMAQKELALQQLIGGNVSDITRVNQHDTVQAEQL
jgi:hypothetical protein